MPVILTLNVQMGQGGLAKPSPQPKMGEFSYHLLETGWGKDQVKENQSPAGLCGLQHQHTAGWRTSLHPAGCRWTSFRTFHHCSGELKASWKTPWSSAAPSKVGGIKVGLLGMFGFCFFFDSSFKTQDAGEINWKSSLGSVSKQMKISGDPCPGSYNFI